MAARIPTMTLRTGKHRNANRRQGRGFTLIELILVMAIMLVVLAVASPALSNFFRGRTLDSEARKMLSMTRYGQERAVTQRSAVAEVRNFAATLLRKKMRTALRIES